MKTIHHFDFQNKKALVRVDFNVPLNADFQITDDTRIQAALPTIKKILSDGGSVVLMSHLGRPKSGPEEKFSLKHIVAHLSKELGTEVQFAKDCVSKDSFELSANLKSGEVLLLENLRFYPQEKAGDKTFSETLAKHGDVYVNDAFGTAHRAHASTAVIADSFKGNKCFGNVMATEIDNLQKVLSDGEKPVTAIMGGAKVSSKISIIEKILPVVDRLIIGGGMSYTFAKAQGGKIGKSLVEDDKLELALELMNKAKENNVELYLPVDSFNGDAFANDCKTCESAIGEVPEDCMGLDIAAKTIEQYQEVLATSKTILWNGPMGVFEMETFSNGTKAIGEAVAKATENGAFSLVGGGDSVAAAKQFGLEKRVSYISTGGGAMLEYLEGRELPGIAAILND
ncbi:MAG: phosphoglycerate kinase [Flavobacteriales bacterium]|jgi:phosphoglycerate kinase|nr:phosphoglycerate kinase [Flavobacteriales bacterium]